MPPKSSRCKPSSGEHSGSPFRIQSSLDQSRMLKSTLVASEVLTKLSLLSDESGPHGGTKYGECDRRRCQTRKSEKCLEHFHHASGECQVSIMTTENTDFIIPAFKRPYNTRLHDFMKGPKNNSLHPWPFRLGCHESTRINSNCMSRRNKRTYDRL